MIQKDSDYTPVLGEKQSRHVETRGAPAPVGSLHRRFVVTPALNFRESECTEPVPAGVQVRQFGILKRQYSWIARSEASGNRSMPNFCSLAGYYQYMADKALIPISSDNLTPGTSIPLPGSATVLLAEKGHIGIVQAKVTFSVKGSPVKIPIALT